MPDTTPFLVRKARRRASDAAAPLDAIAMLRDDHRRVTALFRAFGRDRDDLSPTDKAALVASICRELVVHATLEEEIFYPAAREALGAMADELIDAADIEHRTANALVARLQAMAPDESHYDATVTVLGHYVRHHIAVEHDEIFPRCRRAAGVDLVVLGARLAERRAALQRRN